jgi:hypothetical protein
VSFIDPQTALVEALEFAVEGRYEEALQRHLWIHHHTDRESYWGEWLSSMHAWAILGEMYPPARQALIDIRDQMAATVRAGDWSWKPFYEVAVINERLGEEGETAGLFLDLHQADANRAGQFYRYAEAGLVTRGLYAVCGAHLPDPSSRFEELRAELRRMLTHAAGSLPPDQIGSFRWVAERRLAKKVGRLLTILTAVGRAEEAEHVRASALAEMETAEAQEAIARAGL